MGGKLEDRNLFLDDELGDEGLDPTGDGAAEVVVELIGRVHACRADELREEPAAVDDVQPVLREGPHGQKHAVDRIEQLHGNHRAPLEVEHFGLRDEPNLGREGRGAPEREVEEVRDDREIFRRKDVAAHLEGAFVVPFMNEPGFLRVVDDELGPG